MGATALAAACTRTRTFRNWGQAGTGILLKAGMTLALEPMVNAGKYQVRVKSDNWTVVTVDGQPSAHFEHTVAITEGEPEILTVE